MSDVKRYISFVVLDQDGAEFTKRHAHIGQALNEAIRNYDRRLVWRKAHARQVWLDMKSIGFTYVQVEGKPDE